MSDQRDLEAAQVAGQAETEQSGEHGLEPVECQACWRKVPPGAFCGVCGAHLSTAGRPGVNRRQAYAADPARHVYAPEIISTLLPHLPRRRSAPFRLALLVTLAMLALLGLLQVAAAALAVAALAVPVLYLVYLYEVEVYENEPFQVVGLTVLGGAILGGVWAFLVGSTITQQSLVTAAFGLSLDRVMVAGVLLPVAGQVLMLVPAILLFVIRGRRFDEALDGFTFGAASALGFTLATTLVELFPELSAGPLTTIGSLDNGIDIVVRGLMIPLINASTTGLICATLWLIRGRRRRELHHTLASLPSSAISAVLAQGLLGVSAVALHQPWEQLAVYVAVGLVILLLVRFALHSMLLAEAVEVGIGPPFPCSHCHHVVPRMAFCPSCGIATKATPKTGAGRQDRGVR
jgi:RsiW-degrading membrane proteinase PrsW (M82 family)